MWKYTGMQRPPFADEPAPGQESVWDYPRPPVCQPDQRSVIVRAGDRILAQSSHSIRVLETASPPVFYIPETRVEQDLLEQTSDRSFCEWKGQATYWRLADGGPGDLPVAWSYPLPTPRFADIAGWFSFYPARVHCEVDGEPVLPQPGDFYGGWVTGEISGPFKGTPGTGGW